MSIKEHLDMNALQEIQDCFSKATGFAAITVDYKGVPLLEYSGFSSFCREVRENTHCSDKCYRCDAYGSLEAARKSELHIYHCHMGLVDFSIPIVINGAFLGAIMCGQILVKDAPTTLPSMFDNSEDILTMYPTLSKYYSDIEVVPYNRVYEAAHLLSRNLHLMINESILIREKEELNTLYNKKLQQDLERNHLYLNDYKSKSNHKFFLGALNIIQKQAFLEDALDSEKTINSFAKVYRYYLKDFKKFVTIQKEIDVINHYIYVQHIRFGEFLKFNITVDDEILPYSFPRLVLLTFVENAFTHGLEPKEYLGTISINITKNDDQLFITIEDDGIGMSPDKVNTLNDSNYFKTSKQDLNGQGIFDVYTRLDYFYKDHFSLKFTTKTQGGTKVTLVVPALIEQQFVIE